MNQRWEIGVGGFWITLWNRRWWILLPPNWTRVWWSGPTRVNLFLFGRGPRLPLKELIKAHLSPTLKGTKLLPSSFIPNNKNIFEKFNQDMYDLKKKFNKKKGPKCLSIWPFFPNDRCYFNNFHRSSIEEFLIILKIVYWKKNSPFSCRIFFENLKPWYLH